MGVFILMIGIGVAEFIYWSSLHGHAGSDEAA
jgi:hypothetical protein